MEEMIRQEARLVPTTFLYATESRFRSSTVSSPPIYTRLSLTLFKEAPINDMGPPLWPFVRTFATSYGELANTPSKREVQRTHFHICDHL